MTFARQGPYHIFGGWAAGCILFLISTMKAHVIPTRNFSMIDKVSKAAPYQQAGPVNKAWPKPPYVVPIEDVLGSGEIIFTKFGVGHSSEEQYNSWIDFSNGLLAILLSPSHQWKNFLAVMVESEEHETSGYYFSLNLVSADAGLFRPSTIDAVDVYQTLFHQIAKHELVSVEADIEDLPRYKGRYELLVRPPESAANGVSSMPWLDRAYLLVPPVDLPFLWLLELDKSGSPLPFAGLDHILITAHIQISQMQPGAFDRISISNGAVKFTLVSCAGAQQETREYFARDLALQIIETIHRFELEYKHSMSFKIWSTQEDREDVAWIIGLGNITATSITDNDTALISNNFTAAHASRNSSIAKDMLS